MQSLARPHILAALMGLSLDATPSLLAPPVSGWTVASRRQLFCVCAAIFVVLVAWLLVWRYTGDGDSALHYLLTRRTFDSPSVATTAYARPLHKLLFVLPVRGGMVGARIFAALLAIVTAWQTVRLAEDLKLPRSLLAAPLLVFQPITFALAADIMTEMPMALGIVLGLRLWLRQRFIASCLVVSLLPMVRPEGPFLLPLWGVMMLGNCRLGPFWRRVLKSGALSAGLICWVLSCRVLNHDWLWIYRTWWWTPDSRQIFPPGPWSHYLRYWPEFCGPALLVLFLAGIVPSLKRGMTLPWAVWILVFMLHSFMYWKGLFMSLGLLRWIVPTAPITAVVGLYGFNALADQLARFHVSRAVRRGIGIATLVVIILSSLAYYAGSSERYQTFPIRRCADYIRRGRLLENQPAFFTGDKILLAELGLPEDPRMDPSDRENALKMLRELPRGAVGVWDNRQAEWWYHVDIEEIQRLGFTVLHDARLEAPDFVRRLRYGGPWFVEERYVVLRKN